MSAKLPPVLCESCQNCEGFEVILPKGYVNTHCRRDGFLFARVLPRAECKYYEEEFGYSEK